MQETEHHISDPSAAIALLEKTLTRKCKLHQQFSCEYIHIKPTEFSPRLCSQCVKDQHILSSEYVSINSLLKASSDTTFQDYPKLTDSSINKKLEEFKGSNNKALDDFLSFFDNFQSSISVAIEKQKSAQKDKLSSLQSSYQDLYESFAQISQINKFQELVNDSNDNEEKLKQFIDDQYSQISNYTETMNSKLSEYQKLFNSFSLIDAQNKLERIVKLIEKIEFSPTIKHSQQNNNSQQQPSKQPTFSIKSQQCQHHNPEGYFSTLEVYNQYQSFLEKGFKKRVLFRKFGSPLSTVGSQWWGLSQGQGWQQATTYEEWKEFSEEEQKNQLSILKKALGISD